MMNITIIGQGAMGLLWYHQLAKDVNNDLSLVCSSRIKSSAITSTFTDINKQKSSRVLIKANSEKLQHAELILICVKSYHIESVLSSSAEKFNPTASVIFCHNGLVDYQQFKPLKQPCYALLTTHGSKIIKSFHVEHTGLGHNDLGLISGCTTPVRQDKVLSTLRKALPSLTLHVNIKEKQWLKLAINCIINPITAVDNIENGQLLNVNYNTAIDKLLTEIITVAGYEGIHFDFNELKAQVLSVATKTAKNFSSMRSDILNKRKTEIDYINGYLVDLANKIGLVVPENEKLVQQVKALAV